MRPLGVVLGPPGIDRSLRGGDGGEGPAGARTRSNIWSPMYTANRGTTQTSGAKEVVSSAAAVLGRQTHPTVSPSRFTRFYDGGEKEIIIGGGLPSATMKTRGMTQPASDR
jgi:hypothetical protein